MAYRKYYTLEHDGAMLLGCDSKDGVDALGIIRFERDNDDNNIPRDAKIYSYDVDETQPTAELKVCNKEFVE